MKFLKFSFPELSEENIKKQIANQIHSKLINQTTLIQQIRLQQPKCSVWRLRELKETIENAIPNFLCLNREKIIYNKKKKKKIIFSSFLFFPQQPNKHQPNSFKNNNA